MKTIRFPAFWWGICLFAGLLLTSCTIATMGQIRSAFNDQYFKQLDKKVEKRKLKKLRKYWKRAYREGCKDKGKPCRLGDALEQKFGKLLASCGIKQLMNGGWTQIPPVLQRNLQLDAPVQVFEEDSIQRLFLFLFTSRQLSEYQKNADQEDRFLPATSLSTGQTTLPVPQTKAISYRQTCASLVQAGLKLKVSFRKNTLESALKSQYDTNSYKELLVLRGRFLSPLYFNLQATDNPRRQNTLFLVWQAYSQMKQELGPKKTLPRLKYLQSIRGVTTFETKRDARKVELNVNAAGKTDLWFVDVGGKTRIKYKTNRTFSFRDFATFVFKQKDGKGLKTQIADLPTPSMIRNEMSNQKFRITPSRSILVPNQLYHHYLWVPGLPRNMCTQSLWDLELVSKKAKRWVPFLKLEQPRFVEKKNRRGVSTCGFKILYKMQRTRKSISHYTLHYRLVGKKGMVTAVGNKRLQLTHKSEFSPTDHPQLRFSLPTLSQKRPREERIRLGSRLLLQWDVPVRIMDSKNRIQQVQEVEELQVLCDGGKQLNLTQHSLTPKRPHKNGRMTLSFKAQMGVHSKVRIVPGVWRSCDLEMRVRLRVTRPTKKTEVERIIRGKIQVPKVISLTQPTLPTNKASNGSPPAANDKTKPAPRSNTKK